MTAQESRPTAEAVRRAVLVAAVLPACFTAWVILRYGVDVPYWDQWDLVPLFDKYARGTLGIRDLYAQQNEYRQFFPNLVFLALGQLTRWNVRYEMLLSLALACLVSSNVYRLGKLTAVGDGRQGAWRWLLANLLIFSPMQYENWLFGEQVVYYVPAACVTGCLLVAYSKLHTRTRLLLCACLSGVSTFSAANGILCWVLSVPVLLLPPGGGETQERRRLWATLWMLAVAASAALYLDGYREPRAHPPLTTALAHPFEACVYFLAFLGAPFGVGRRPLVVAVAAGAALLAAFAVALCRVLRHRRDVETVRRSLCWLMLGAYSLLTGGMVTVGRLGFGLEQARSSRYVAFSIYLAVSLVYLAPVVSAREHAWMSRRARGWLASGAAVCLVAAQLLVAALVVRHNLPGMRRQRLQAKACLLLVNVLEEGCAEEPFPVAALLRERAGVLDRLGFLRPPLLRSGRLREFAADAGPGGFGSFDGLRREGASYVATGRAVLPERGAPADAVLLAYEEASGERFIFALNETRVGEASADNAAWAETFRADALPPEAVRLSAWAFDAETAKAYPLDGTKPYPPERARADTR